MLGDLLVRVDPHDEVVTHGLGLAEGVGVAEVDHVVAAVAPNATHIRRGHLEQVESQQDCTKLLRGKSLEMTAA